MLSFFTNVLHLMKEFGENLSYQKYIDHKLLIKVTNQVPIYLTWCFGLNKGNFGLNGEG